MKDLWLYKGGMLWILDRNASQKGNVIHQYSYDFLLILIILDWERGLPCYN
jgi:hypothetical protein